MSYDWNGHDTQIEFSIRSGRHPLEVDAEMRFPEAELGDGGRLTVTVNMRMPIDAEMKVRAIQHRAIAAAISVLREWEGAVQKTPEQPAGE